MTIERGLNEALRASRVDLDSEAGFEELLELVELTTGARAVRTEEAQRFLTLDQPGREVLDGGWFEVAAYLG